MLKKVIVASVFVLSTISGIYFSLKGKYIHERLLFNHTAPKIYKVTNIEERGSGSGSVVELNDGRKIVLTNRHVCEIKNDNNDVLLIDHKGEKHIRKVLAMDSVHDLCAIQPVNYDDAALFVASDAPEVSDHVFVVGHPAGRPTSLSYGMLVSLKEEVTINYGMPKNGAECWGEKLSVDDAIKKSGITNPIEIIIIKAMFGPFLCLKTLNSYMSTAPGEPGNSGSPVLNFNGDIVAVLFAGDSSPHMSLLVPHHAIKEFLSKI